MNPYPGDTIKKVSQEEGIAWLIRRTDSSIQNIFFRGYYNGTSPTCMCFVSTEEHACLAIQCHMQQISMGVLFTYWIGKQGNDRHVFLPYDEAAALEETAGGVPIPQ